MFLSGLERLQQAVWSAGLTSGLSFADEVDRRLAHLLGERLAPGVEVVERGVGWNLLGLVWDDGDAAESAGRGRLLAAQGSFLAARDMDLRGPTEAWQAIDSVPASLAVRLTARPARRVLQTASEHAPMPPTLLAWSRPQDWLTMAARLGVHQATQLPSGTLLVGVSGRLLRRERQGWWQTALRYDGFRKPTRAGLLVDRQGRAWVAQYAMNRDRSQPIRLWRSENDGKEFAAVRTFGPGEVRHIHFIQQDPIDGALWLGTGDRDSESAIWRSPDGQDWQQVGGGSQLWRAMGLGFTPDAVVWGTDAGLDAPHFDNALVRWSRASGELTVEQSVQGPVHSVATLPDGRVAASTGCEGGGNERDNRVHLWLRETGGTWRELASWRKGPQPPRVQYAVGHLVAGQERCDDLWLQLRGTAAMPLGFVRLRIA